MVKRILAENHWLQWDSILVMALSMGLLVTPKIPAPLIVAAALTAGFVL